MPAKNKVVVHINGYEYTLMGDESQEYLYRVALYVDKKLSEVMQTDLTLNSARASILTALNVADDHLKLVDELSMAKEIIKGQDQKIAELNKLTEENKALKERVEEIKGDLSRKERDFVDFMTAFNATLNENQEIEKPIEKSIKNDKIK